MRLPDFIIIGSAKSGRTTLYQYLQQHPSVFMSMPKEPAFFAIDGLYSDGLANYGALFAATRSDQVCGEASTRYSCWPHYPRSAERIAHDLPHAKLIYIMREPVSRAYSHYVQLIRNARARNPDLEVEETFEEHIRRDTTVLDASLYMKQIERYLRFSPRSAMLLLLMDDLVHKPASVMEQVYRHIGVELFMNSADADPIVANQLRDYAWWQVRSRLTAPVRALPGGGERIASMLPKPVRDGIYQILKRLPARRSVERRYIPPPMQPETRIRLREMFKEPNEQLAEFLGRDLSHWCQRQATQLLFAYRPITGKAE